MPVRIPITHDSQIEVAIASLKAVVPPEDLAQEPEACPEEKLVGEPNAG